MDFAELDGIDVRPEGREQGVDEAAGVARGHQVGGLEADDADPEEGGEPLF